MRHPYITEEDEAELEAALEALTQRRHRSRQDLISDRIVHEVDNETVEDHVTTNEQTEPSDTNP